MFMETGKTFADPSAMTRRGLRLLGFASFNDLVLVNTLVFTKHPEH